MKEIKTSDSRWAILLAKSYKEKTPVILIDDASIGINPLNETLLQMGMKGKLKIQVG